MNRDDDALASYEKAIGLRRENAEALLNKSQVKLSLGDFEEGWALYEWRWKSRFFTAPVRNFSQKSLLEDADVAGRTVLVHSEQGFGDTIQFYRYIAKLGECGCEIVFEAPAPLVPLIRAQRGNSKIISAGEALPSFDIHCPLLSLPHFSRQTRRRYRHRFPIYLRMPENLNSGGANLAQKANPELVWCGPEIQSIRPT